MVRWTADHNIYIKILYWGMGGSGKTTIVDTLYRLTKEQEKDIESTEKIHSSLWRPHFDRGIFQSTEYKMVQVFYHIFTVASQDSLRKKVFEGADGVIFTVDSQAHFFEDNVESLRGLKSIARDKLIKEIPLIVMLNKQDLKNVISDDNFIHILKKEKLWYKPENDLFIWNPLIYKTCALYNKEKDIYRSFHEIARRTALYHIYGDGQAPVDKTISDTSILTT